MLCFYFKPINSKCPRHHSLLPYQGCRVNACVVLELDREKGRV